MLRDSFYYGSSPSASSTRSTSNQPTQSGSRLGKWVGWRPWGGGGGNNGGNSGGNSGTGGGGSTAASECGSSIKASKEPDQKQSGRSPGINQRGAIPGFAEYMAASQKKLPPPKILPDLVDEDALREGLIG